MPKSILCSSSGDSDVTSHTFVEISIDPSLLNNFSNEDGMTAYLSSYSGSEEFQKLRTDLFEEVMYLIDNCLTEKQKQVMIMTYIDGKTQNEISIELGRHQTAVHKTLQGNIDYGNDGKRYGGAIKKLRKLCANNDKIQGILKRMKEFRQDIGDSDATY